jgi:excinuclease ABC subunit C
MTKSILDEIPGVGPKRRQQLIRHFGSMKQIRLASLEQLKEAGLPEKLAESVLQYVHEETDE